MIIASAILFHIDKTDEDVVLCGLRHADIYKQLKLLGFKPKQGYKEIAQGFINDSGDFLSREEAYIQALSCNQISEKSNKSLFSEDLW